jgi:SAM-dependent methyltransferase
MMHGSHREDLRMQYPKARTDWRSRAKRALHAPSPALNTSRRLDWLLAHFDESARVLDLGSGTHRLRPSIIDLEIGPFPNVDLVGDGASLPFADRCFDAVICQAVLEHVRAPESIVAEIGRVLQPGGYVYAEIPFLQGFHADPHDYQRYTLPGIQNLFRDFQKVDSGVCVGPSSTLAWILREYLSLLVGEGKIRSVASQLFGWLTFWVKYLDIWLAGHPQAHVIASGLYFAGRKGDSPADYRSTHD